MNSCQNHTNIKIKIKIIPNPASDETCKNSLPIYWRSNATKSHTYSSECSLSSTFQPISNARLNKSNEIIHKQICCVHKLFVRNLLNSCCCFFFRSCSYFEFDCQSRRRKKKDGRLYANKFIVPFGESSANAECDCVKTLI